MIFVYGVLGVVGVGVGAVLLLASRKPETFRVERRAVIAAPPSAVFPNLDDFHRWSAWSPWEKLDPDMKRTFGGPERGVGATYAWQGNGKAGEGRMEIVETVPDERVTLALEFVKPFPATNTTTFTLTPRDGGTEVVWALEGRNTFMGKVFSVFADMDSMVGKDFDEGLRNLERVARG